MTPVRQEERSLEDLAREAHAYTRAIAVIPVDPAIDQRVEAMVAGCIQGVAAKRPMRRPTENESTRG